MSFLSRLFCRKPDRVISISISYDDLKKSQPGLGGITDTASIRLARRRSIVGSRPNVLVDSTIGRQPDHGDYRIVEYHPHEGCKPFIVERYHKAWEVSTPAGVRQHDAGWLRQDVLGDFGAFSTREAATLAVFGPSVVQQFRQGSQ